KGARKSRIPLTPHRRLLRRTEPPRRHHQIRNRHRDQRAPRDEAARPSLPRPRKAQPGDLAEDAEHPWGADPLARDPTGPPPTALIQPSRRNGPRAPSSIKRCPTQTRRTRLVGPCGGVEVTVSLPSVRPRRPGW